MAAVWPMRRITSDAGSAGMTQLAFAFGHELIVDNFAGGGGASYAIEQAFGRSVDIAINHDPEAIAMHMANHPSTRHYCESVWDVDPVKATGGRQVGLAWFSPDCKHFSKAKGGKPVDKNIRGLAWVVIRWAKTVKPRVIILENVEEFQTWGPLIHAVKDGDRQYHDDGRPMMQPCPNRKGETFAQWKGELQRLGYKVEHRELRACDYGAPTIRKRLFLVARCDGLPIRWPAPTHGPNRPLPYRTAAECIDWSIPCPSIFERKRPLAEATQRRIARGIQRFVIDHPDPFIVPIANYNGSDRVHSLHEPLRTITANPKGGCFSVVVPHVVKHFGGMTGVDARTPFPTIMTRGTQNQLVTSHMIKLRGTCQDGQDWRQPGPTVTAGGTHVGQVQVFLMKYYGTGGQWQDLRDPLHTVPTKGRFALVTIHGERYQIADIGMRMLSPRELYRCQGFPDDYQIDIEHNGKPLTKTAQVRMVGNSVSPPPAIALVAANVGEIRQAEAVA